MSARCPVVNCQQQKTPMQLACRNHWFALPKDVRDQIWKLFRDLPGTEMHRAACFEALEFLNSRETTKGEVKP